ncbi:MAG: hypothetical protein KDI98_06690 [Hyphomicrobiaceae bacterium]|nr:hypothetical protein [Hyphomicrobiaceae bacterium]
MEIPGLAAGGIETVSQQMFEQFVDANQSFDNIAYGRSNNLADVIGDALQLQSASYLMLSISSVPRSVINNLKG